MKAWVLAALLGIVAAVAWAQDASAPARPADQETAQADKSQSDARSSSADARNKGEDGKVAQQSSDEFPTPEELVKKMKKMEEERAKLPKVAFFNLSRPIEEKPADFSWFGEDGGVTLRDLTDRIRAAAKDKDIKAVLITLGEGGMNFAQAQEIRDALSEATSAGKKTIVYADSYDTVGYTVASGAGKVCLLPGGEIMIPGVGMEATFAKGLLDKIGVKADYVQIGEYKGADEEFTRTEASEELRGELNKLTQSLYDQIVDEIASHRKLSKDTVRHAIDETILTAENAKSQGFVDELIDQDDLRPMLNKELGGEVDLLADFGRPQREAVDLSSPFALFSLFTRRSEAPPTDKSSVAIIYASGVIVDGEGEGGLLSEEGVGSERMRKAFRVAARDNNIKAVVIRIDSPGGSALASEVMWQAARHVAEKKPVIISVGSMAASGGYYLASAGDYIFADSSGIVGSIGVVGGKFVLHDLFDKLGVNTEIFSKGRNAGLFSMSQPWSDRQRQMVKNWMSQTYDQFTRRVMKTRGGKIKDIDKVARGRIFLAPKAKELGLVDQIGGLEDALAYAAKKAGVEAGQYNIRVLPQPKTLGDLLSGNGPDAAMPFRPKIDLGQPLRHALGKELQLFELFQDRPIALVAPFSVEIR